MKELIINDRVYGDLEEASDFYERQDPGCGDYFNRSISADIHSLHQLHGIHRHHFGYHRMRASRFPHGIYYRVSETEIRVVAVLDMRRDPAWIEKQLRKR